MNVKLDFAIHTLFTVVWEQVWCTNGIGEGTPI